MKKLTKSKGGFSLVEVIITLAVFAIISTGILSVITSSQKVTDENMQNRPLYEETVGVMDGMLSSDLSAVDGEDITVKVTFPTGAEVDVDSKVVRDAHYGNAAIVKKK